MLLVSDNNETNVIETNIITCAIDPFSSGPSVLVICVTNMKIKKNINSANLIVFIIRAANVFLDSTKPYN